MAQGWRNASFEPIGVAPDPATTPEAVVQVYAARAWGWRGYFGVHTWIAVKPTKAPEYTVYEVIGWRLRWGESALVVRHRAPDARWFGNAPALLIDLRGDGVDDIIRRVDVAARRYPYAGEYTVWPGPNSNTFTAFVAREVPSSKLICRRRRLEKIIWAAGWWPKRRAALGCNFRYWDYLAFWRGPKKVLNSMSWGSPLVSTL